MSESNIPETKLVLNGLPLNARGLRDIAKRFEALATKVELAERRGCSIETIGGIVFNDEKNADIDVFGITSDMKVCIGPLPPFKWKEGDEFDPDDLWISEYVDSINYMPARRGIQVLHLRAGVEARVDGGHQFSNKAKALALLRELIDEKFGGEK